MNKLTPDEITTIDTYNKHADVWAGTHDDDDFYEKEYGTLKKLLPEGKILEIGCGAGRDADFLTKLGYGYLGTDIADKLLKAAKKRVPHAHFMVSDIYSMDFKEKFDGFWCAAVLLHIPRQRLHEALKAIAKQIKRGGIGFISTKEGTSDEMEPLKYDTDSSRLQVHYSKEAFDQALEAAGFKIVDYSYRPLNERAKWLCYFVEKV